MSRVFANLALATFGLCALVTVVSTIVWVSLALDALKTVLR